MGNHCTGGYHRTSTNSNTTHNGTIGTQRGPFFYQCLLIYTMYRIIGTRNQHIGKHATGTTKNIILQFNTFVYRHVILDANTITNAYPIADINILPQGASFSNTSTRLDMTEMPYLRACTYLNIIVNIAALVNIYIIFYHTNRGGVGGFLPSGDDTLASPPMPHF